MNIKQFIGIVILIVCFALDSTGQKIIQKKLPINLNEAISYLNNDWSLVEKRKFKNLPEDKAVTSLHFSTGLWIRNNWIHGDRDTALVNYFHRIGIYAADDISSIIITSFHRKLNHKPLDLNGQILPYKSYWKSIKDCEEKKEKIALINYNKFDIGSPIVIIMPVDVQPNERNAVSYECPNPDWKFNPKKDLLINGVVKEKYFINSNTNVFFKVQIDKMNYPNTTIFMNKVNIGSVVDFSLKNLTIQ